MIASPHPIRFLLNHEEVASTAPRGLLVLDWLRKRRGLVGTKEGCKEGDCGACGVLVGDCGPEGIQYRPVTSCLLPLGELAGKHLVTIEGINLPGSALSPLQAAVVREGGTQCGFCTPGIILSMTHCLMEHGSHVTHDAMKIALSGHLCRCTGYGSLKRAGDQMKALWNDVASDAPTFELRIPALVELQILPAYFLDIPDRLRALQADVELDPAPPAPAFRIAGGTDLYVQRGRQIPDTDVDILNQRPDLAGIERKEDHLEVGALTTFEQFGAHPEVRKLIPRIEEFLFLIASLQIRNRATLSGNVINASPIGDMTILLLALGARITLASDSGTRTIPLEDLYLGYKQLGRTDDEFLTRFTIPCASHQDLVHFEKVSKRKCLDIASVNSAIRLSVANDQIRQARLSIGGVAAVPKYLPEASAWLTGRTLSEDTVRELRERILTEISPIDDVRGSADYKRALACQLTAAHFVELFPETIKPEAFL